MTRKIIATLIFAALASACGGHQQPSVETSQPTPSTTTEPPTTTAPPTTVLPRSTTESSFGIIFEMAWEELTYDEQESICTMWDINSEWVLDQFDAEFGYGFPRSDARRFFNEEC
jgi:hypothetical protein